MNVQLDTDLTQGPALGVQLLRAHVHGATVTTAYSVHRSLGRRPADLGGLNDDDLGWPAGCRSSTWSWCCLALIAGVSRRLGEAVDPARARKTLELVLAGVLDLEIRSLKEADRSSGDEHLPGLREGSDTGDCMQAPPWTLPAWRSTSPEWKPIAANPRVSGHWERARGAVPTCR